MELLDLNTAEIQGNIQPEGSISHSLYAVEA